MILLKLIFDKRNSRLFIIFKKNTFLVPNKGFNLTQALIFTGLYIDFIDLKLNKIGSGALPGLMPDIGLLKII